MSFNRDTPIAFLGMGLMGSRMAARLIHAGFQVAVWNRTASACAPLLDTGAKALDLEQLGRYKIILTCLADDQAVQQVFNQIQPYLKPGQTIVDFSSLSVDKTLELAQAARRQHVNWIDSPVSGGTAGAEQGTLVIFAGGNAEKIQDLTLVYNVLSQRVTRMGETGTGQATKICNQLIVAANSTLIAEAVALAEQAGVDTRLLAPALAGGFADSKPFQILAPRMATHVFEPVQWKVQTLSKDLGNAVKLAEQFKLDIPVAKQALTQLTSHQQNGFAEKDLATVIQQVKS
ncbi:NAD(P)-dependent oxidoreductase [Acinetobacter radioresistens]|jgi:3-hydroxyisobutyrate dehydrogenase|uniref:NAD(P)-dependent oxidoreductase n=1 Tax=Acinetobacter radioresistens TaxID=40216 RepID=A0A3D3G390_ACIRA|nr:NAD(P)-dependent oxidoreductase [Acinetobacter radioresistens]MCK4080046.1 NAD(P)-dependent oxidoreductase [Acinetobacter radioresistens]MCK4102372.1 NAD(P)-dependent oxidoreductase [Acinetobacter radioresistens]MDK8754619.1 NAD(P)-dependent oxidoreductase [Acinetobacter radioresistens]QCS11453.1 NAD(P)-dependent oxidoreductase [Acinetobacter radioresistens]HCM32134.1 NAD(P)-dependent oxidoreductase [Acinetobacter radioresistens]